jgi:signal transduction histidine kinase
LSILKLDALAGKIEAKPGAPVPEGTLGELSVMSRSLQDALKEMRGIASGLSLPQLNDLSLPETVFRVARAHERQTGSQVDVDMENVPEQVSLPARITVYRLIQEALNNAFRHANGLGQRVRIREAQGQLVVEVSDLGPGFDPKGASQNNGRLGLSGMRERVESLGGRFEIESAPGRGTHLRAHIPYRAEGPEND